MTHMAKQFQGKKNMDVVTYTGNGNTQSIGGLDFSPDLVWVKGRKTHRHMVLMLFEVHRTRSYSHIPHLRKEPIQQN